MGAGYGDARSLWCILYFQNIYFGTLCRLEHLALYLLSLIQDSVNLTKVDADVLA